MTQIWIVWQSSGSYEDFHKSIHKIYKDELVALDERDRLNQGLKDEKERLNKILEIDEDEYENLSDDEEKKYREASSCLWILQEQHDYTVEAFNVEDGEQIY